MGGALSTLALTHFGTKHPTYGRNGSIGIVGVIAVGVIAVVVSYAKVRGIV